jgi:hypothetical protein
MSEGQQAVDGRADERRSASGQADVNGSRRTAGRSSTELGARQRSGGARRRRSGVERFGGGGAQAKFSGQSSEAGGRQ